MAKKTPIRLEDNYEFALPLLTGKLKLALQRIEDERRREAKKNKLKLYEQYTDVVDLGEEAYKFGSISKLLGGFKKGSSIRNKAAVALNKFRNISNVVTKSVPKAEDEFLLKASRKQHRETGGGMPVYRFPEGKRTVFTRKKLVGYSNANAVRAEKAAEDAAEEARMEREADNSRVKTHALDMAKKMGGLRLVRAEDHLNSMINIGEQVVAYKFFGDPFTSSTPGKAPEISPKRINPKQGGIKPDKSTTGFTFGKQGKPVQLMAESSNKQESSVKQNREDYSDDWRDKMASYAKKTGDVCDQKSESRKNPKRLFVRVERQ
jgi:hypothetical protein